MKDESRNTDHALLSFSGSTSPLIAPRLLPSGFHPSPSSPMSESLRTRFLRWKFNWFPSYRRSGARITYIDATLREVRLRLPLNWRTRNLNGTIYGGSIYAAVDPIHAVMLVSLLGPRDYVAWTKEAHVRFKRQARTALTAQVVLTPEEVTSVRADVERDGRVERRYPVDLRDTNGKVCATCDILVHLHARERPEAASAPAEAPGASAASAL